MSEEVIPNCEIGKINNVILCHFVIEPAQFENVCILFWFSLVILPFDDRAVLVNSN